MSSTSTRRQFLTAAAAAPAALAALPAVAPAAPPPDDLSALVGRLAVTLSQARQQIAELQTLAPAAGPIDGSPWSRWEGLHRDLIACDVGLEVAGGALRNSWHQEVAAALVAAGLERARPAMARQNA